MGVAVGIGTGVGDVQAPSVSVTIIANSVLTKRKNGIIRPFPKSKGAR